MFVTSRLRYSTSRSIASAVSRCSAGVRPLSGCNEPAAARIVASGVRRSWDTDWRSADLRASLCRATSAACDSAARRSWASAWPTWSAAAAYNRVSVRSGSPRRRSRRAQIEPYARPPDSIRARKASCPPPPRADAPGRWTRTQPAGSSLEARPRTLTTEGRAGRVSPPLSAATRSDASSAPSATHTRAARVSSRQDLRDMRQGEQRGHPRGERAAHAERAHALRARAHARPRPVTAGARRAGRPRCRRTAAARASSTRRGRR